MAQFFFTEKGYQALQAEIERLDKLLKNDIAKEIATAAAHGDLKENGEYHAAKEKQSHTATRLRQLQERFSGANVVRKDELLPEESVTFGKRVKIREVNTGKERECTILGDGETDSEKGIIAYNSPLASALIGHVQGDVVDVQLPVGLRTYEILDCRFAEGYQD
ncbi:MAG TPA: transcription elongation factor GreA [Candidatus Krumholzibacteria bacterium]|nr:transcription elongation factor GreA [Candidatus Krumholzibacteria bacterium]